MKLRKLLESVDFAALKKQFRSTIPKIPTNQIFKNEVSQPSMDERKPADKYFENDAFEQLPSVSVDVNDIIPTQKTINIDNLQKVKNTTKRTDAFLLKSGGKYYVLDGHHRIAINILNNNNTIIAYVYGE